MVPRPIRTVTHTLSEVFSALRICGDVKSKLRLASDFVLYRVMKILPHLATAGAERTIVFNDGVKITYRLNRGDIQSIREIFFDQSYRLPFSARPTSIVDLGANIGLTSLWLSRRYGPSKVYAVEADASNAKLVRKNFLDNAIEGEVIEAAIGSRDATVFFSHAAESNLGQVSTEGIPVKMISMSTVLTYLPENQSIDLLKLDIEGGETDLLSGDIQWLHRVKHIIAEFHPDRVDYSGLVRTIENAGFVYLAADTVFRNNMDAFEKIP